MLDSASAEAPSPKRISLASEQIRPLALEVMTQSWGNEMGRRTLPGWVAALAAYVGVASAFFAPVASKLETSVLGRGDSLQFLWSAWWMEHTLFKGRNPFFTDLVFAPIGSPLVFHSFAPLQVVSVTVADWFLPLELAWNLVIMAGLPLAGMGAWLLCRHVTRDPVASWVGGLVFMLSPFIVGKAGAGWLNMLYAGVLPVFTWALLRATDPRERGVGPRLLLAGSTLAVLFTSVVTTVLAANVAVGVLAWRLWEERPRLDAGLRFVRACLPAFCLALPYLVLVAYYVVVEDFAPTARRGEAGFLPHLSDFLLPTVMTSPYADAARALVDNTGDYRWDSACYLGLFVLPFAAIGLYRRWQDPPVRLFAGLLVFSVVISAGPFLLVDGEFVHLWGRAVPMPFALWREIPMLGMIGQTGRYMAIAYMALAVGVAAAVALFRARPAEWASRAKWAAQPSWGRAVVFSASLAICVDFAFQPILIELPAPIELSDPEGQILDPRPYVGATMYQQTLHGRPMVGGYLARRPPRALEFYRQRPGIACLMHFLKPRQPCDDAEVLAALRELGVTDVVGSANDPRGPVYERIGLTRHYEDESTVVWAVPAPGDERPHGSDTGEG